MGNLNASYVAQVWKHFINQKTTGADIEKFLRAAEKMKFPYEDLNYEQFHVMKALSQGGRQDVTAYDDDAASCGCRLYQTLFQDQDDDWHLLSEFRDAVNGQLSAMYLDNVYVDLYSASERFSPILEESIHCKSG